MFEIKTTPFKANSLNPTVKVGDKEVKKSTLIKAGIATATVATTVTLGIVGKKATKALPEKLQGEGLEKTVKRGVYYAKRGFWEIKTKVQKFVDDVDEKLRKKIADFKSKNNSADVEQPIPNKPVSTEGSVEQPTPNKPVEVKTDVEQPTPNKPVEVKTDVEQPIPNKPVEVKTDVEQPIPNKPVEVKTPKEPKTTSPISAEKQTTQSTEQTVTSKEQPKEVQNTNNKAPIQKPTQTSNQAPTKVLTQTLVQETAKATESMSEEGNKRMSEVADELIASGVFDGLGLF